MGFAREFHDVCGGLEGEYLLLDRNLFWPESFGRPPRPCPSRRYRTSPLRFIRASRDSARWKPASGRRAWHGRPRFRTPLRSGGKEHPCDRAVRFHRGAPRHRPAGSGARCRGRGRRRLPDRAGQPVTVRISNVSAADAHRPSEDPKRSYRSARPVAPRPPFRLGPVGLGTEPPRRK